MPVVAVVPAVVAIGAAIATETITVFTVAAVVGSVVATVGTFTGVKELQIAGTVLGAVGAVGGLASAAGMFGSAAANGAAAGGIAETQGALATETIQPISASTTSVAQTPEVLNGVGAVNAATAPAVDPGVLPGTMPGPEAVPAGLTDPASGVLDQVLGAGSADPLAGAVNGATDPLAGAVNGQSGSLINPAAEVNPAGADATLSPDGSVVPEGDGGPSSSPAGDNGQYANTNVVPQNAAPTSAAPQTPGGAGAAPVTQASTVNPMDGGVPGSFDKAVAAVNKFGPAPVNGPSTWSNILKFAKDNQMLVTGAMMGLGSFLSGAMNPKSGAEIEALQAQARRSQAEAGLINTQDQMTQYQLENMRSPLPMARRRTSLISG